MLQKSRLFTFLAGDAALSFMPPRSTECCEPPSSCCKIRRHSCPTVLRQSAGSQACTRARVWTRESRTASCHCEKIKIRSSSCLSAKLCSSSSRSCGWLVRTHLRRLIHVACSAQQVFVVPAPQGWKTQSRKMKPFSNRFAHVCRPIG